MRADRLLASCACRRHPVICVLLPFHASSSHRCTVMLAGVTGWLVRLPHPCCQTHAFLHTQLLELSVPPSTHPLHVHDHHHHHHDAARAALAQATQMRHVLTGTPCVHSCPHLTPTIHAGAGQVLGRPPDARCALATHACTHARPNAAFMHPSRHAHRRHAMPHTPSSPIHITPTYTHVGHGGCLHARIHIMGRVDVVFIYFGGC